MSTKYRPARRAQPSPESGIAMVTAIMVIMVLSLVAIVAVQLSFHNQGTSNVDRKRTQSVTAAEAGMDLSYKQVSTTTLPCNMTGTFPTSPTQSKYAATIQYFSAYPGDTSTALACDASGTVPISATSPPKSALINVVGSTNAKIAGDRKLQTLVKLNPILPTNYDKAIYANGTLSFANNTTILGSGSANADVYSSQPFNCTNSLQLNGSVNVQSTATLSNSCHIVGDIYALGNVTMSNGTVDRDVKSRANITLTGVPAHIGNNAIATGTVSVLNAGQVGNTISQGQASLPPPPTLPFPQYNWDAAAQAQWSAAGWTVVGPITDCTTGPLGIYATVAAMSAATGPKVIYTTCPLNWSNNTDLVLAQDVAIYSTGGFAPVNRFDVSSSVAGTKRHMYWLVPYNAAPMPCATPSIVTSNLTKFTDVELFMYTPCDVSVNNNTSSAGQIYSGGNVTTSNLFTLQFQPVPILVTSSGTPPLPTGFKVDIAYKREVKVG